MDERVGEDEMVRNSEARVPVTERKPVLAVVGATDLAVEKVRAAVNAGVERAPQLVEGRLGKARNSIQDAVGTGGLRSVWEGRRLQEGLQRVPAVALGRAITVASRAETEYEQLAVRGRTRVEHLRTQESTQQAVARGRSTLARTQAVIVEGRRGVEEALTVVRQVVRARGETSRGASQEVEVTVTSVAVSADDGPAADAGPETTGAAAPEELVPEEQVSGDAVPQAGDTACQTPAAEGDRPE
jgi:hypothetical protein